MPRALLSVYDKTGIVEFARELAALGWDLVSSGGTAKVIGEAGIAVTDVADLTGFPAILGHRVVTLHPAIHGALLADTDNLEHVSELEKYEITPIQLAVINLYEFSSNPSIELIDVGGPAMVRASAKNFAHVAIATEPSQYGDIIDELRLSGVISASTRLRLAAQAFAVTAGYDAQVASWFAAQRDAEQSHSPHTPIDNSGAELPDHITLNLVREQTLRYGENPHQRGARYSLDGAESWWSSVVQHGGKEMSYLNVLDTQAAWDLAWSFDGPSAVVIKHANPCGLAVAADITEAYCRAHSCDPLSAFGGVVALNEIATTQLARELIEVFTEVVIAPGFEPEALQILQSKKNLRILVATAPNAPSIHVRQIAGGFLVQDADTISGDTSAWKIVGTVQPTPQQWQDSITAWITCAAVSSNAIVLVRDGQAIGIGGGQQNRLDASRLACERAGARAVGAVAASDAFFPFRDGPDALAAAGITAIVQPGGSQRDDETIASANENGIAMIFTGARHFRH
jgi:phosphoribosylaminoimidazolecarboxamide formyltransferase/IMP cyclohydrolase